MKPPSTQPAGGGGREATARHTPGPWGAAIPLAGEDEWFVDGPIDSDYEEMMICANRREAPVAIVTGLVGDPEFEANAHLIAAAPALYEALRLVGRIAAGEEHGSGLPDITRIVRAALAAAAEPQP